MRTGTHGARGRGCPGRTGETPRRSRPLRTPRRTPLPAGNQAPQAAAAAILRCRRKGTSASSPTTTCHSCNRLGRPPPPGPPPVPRPGLAPTGPGLRSQGSASRGAWESGSPSAALH
eukprot:4997246-Heterocapsa_arctica.AAC.1